MVDGVVGKSVFHHHCNIGRGKSAGGYGDTGIMGTDRVMGQCTEIKR